MTIAAPAAAATARGYQVNGLNQYTGTTFGGAPNWSFEYDPNGNLTRSVDPAGTSTTAYRFDVENRLVAASGAANATLVYDPLGRLFQLTGANGAVTRFLYEGDRLVAEYDGSGALTKRYVHGPGADEPVAVYAGPGLGLAGRRYLLPDERGSIIALVDTDGSPSAINRYDPWGMPPAAGPPNQGRFQYTGQAWIEELGLYHYKARLYSPSLGRFLQTDPIGYGDDINLYAYVGNDPVNRTDPTGLYACTGSRLCGTFADDQTAAIQRLAGQLGLLRNLARDVGASRKLSSEEKQAQATMNRFLGGGAGNNVGAINRLIAAGQSIMSVLQSQAAVKIHRQVGTFYATTRGGLRSPMPTYLYPRYFRSSNEGRQETIVHEGSHKALGTRDFHYGVAASMRFAITNPSSTMQSAENVAMALGFTRDD